MSLKHAILGFLNYKPSTGYELKAIFDTSVQHFWTADQAQIYRTLTELTEQQLATVEVIPQQDRPNRKVYTITPAGRAELRRWLTAPLTYHEFRSAALIQVFFAGQLSDGEMLAIFERAASEMRAVLAVYDLIPANIGPYIEMVGSPRETYCWLLTLESGFNAMRANLAWCDSVISRIKAGELPPA